MTKSEVLKILNEVSVARNELVKHRMRIKSGTSKDVSVIKKTKKRIASMLTSISGFDRSKNS